MSKAGYSPSVRLFEAGACAVPVISDWWPGLDSIFRIGKEVLLAETTEDRHAIYARHFGRASVKRSPHAARRRVLAEHTPEQRALQLEKLIKELAAGMKLVIFGLSISSSWGNGHATLWRGIMRGTGQARPPVVFFERDVPYYAANRDYFEIPARRTGSLRGVGPYPQPRRTRTSPTAMSPW